VPAFGRPAAANNFFVLKFLHISFDRTFGYSYFSRDFRNSNTLIFFYKFYGFPRRFTELFTDVFTEAFS